MTKGRVRKVTSRVAVSYGNGDVAREIEISANNESPSVNLSTLFSQRYKPKVKAFTLEGAVAKDKSSFTLGEGRALVDPTVIGWWSESFSSSAESEYGGYEFPAPLKLTVDFGNPRPISELDVFADPILGEYPIRFGIELYRSGEEGPCYSRDIDYTKYPDSEIAEEDRYQRKIKLKEKTSLGSGSAEDYMTEIRKAVLTVYAWNKPDRLSKIYRFYDDVLEVYNHDELQLVECVSECSNNGEVQYGLVSGSCAVTILNKDRKFDRDYLNTMVHINRKVVPYINDRAIGTYFIKEWNVPQDELFVKLKANDRLMDFQEITYEGMMPKEKENEKEKEKVSFGELFETVLEYADSNYMESSNTAAHYECDIDEKLFANGDTDHDRLVKVEPYLPRDSVWSVLELLCNASMSFVYVDNDGKIKVKSELFKSDDDNTVTDEKLDISTDNAFSIKIPFIADMSANRVEVPYYAQNISDEEEELFKAEVKDLEQGVLYTMPFELNGYGNISKVIVNRKPIECFTVQMSDLDNRSTNKLTGKLIFVPPEKLFVESNDEETEEDVFALDMTGKSKTDPEEDERTFTVTVSGYKIAFNKRTYMDCDQKSVNNNGLSLYTHPDCELIQSENLAKHIAKRILNIYVAGTKSATCEWRGDEDLDVTEKYYLTDRFDQRGLYRATYVKNTMDGGLRQEVKGILVKEVESKE